MVPSILPGLYYALAGEAREAGAEFLVSPHCDPELAAAW